MPKYAKPLSQNPFHQWGTRMGGAAPIDPNDLADRLVDEVTIAMANQHGINVSGKKAEVTIGGLFSSTTFPGVSFTFEGHSDWAGYLVGINKKAAIISIDVVQVGTPSKAVQRMNMAESKGALSFSGAFQRAITDQDAVETERMYYATLLQVITEVVNSWME